MGQLDRVLHGPVRLGVMAYLAEAGVADFAELRRLLGVTQGNLSVQLRNLENAGYATVEQGFLERRPRTRISITAAGRAAVTEYAGALTSLLSPFCARPD